MANEISSVVPADPHLQQGDIFALGLVLPFADADARLFRTRSAAHGSRVFADNQSAEVFSPSDVASAINLLPDPDPFHTHPFSPDPNGTEEFVVVQARYVDKFILASQTCDISGADKDAIPYCMIMPIYSFMNLARNERIPLYGDQDDGNIFTTTAHDYLSKNAPIFNTEPVSDLQYHEDFLAAIDLWDPPKKSVHRKNLNVLRDVFGKFQTRKSFFAVKASEDVNFPMSVVDFAQVFVVPTPCLTSKLDRRVGTLNSSIAKDFSTKFAGWISRVAIANELQPGPFLPKG